jgi:DNA-binding NtrC family response regulator
VEQAAMRSDSARIEPAHLEQVLRESGVERVAPAASAGPVPAGSPNLLRPLAEQVAELERAAIEAALVATSGNKVAAARLLGISRAKLYERMTDLQTTV